MLTAQSLLRTARAIGLTFDVAGDSLVIDADRDPPPTLLAELRRHKFELIALLKQERAEQAAPIDGGSIPRAWAEGLARLDPDQPPGDTPPERWQIFITDVGRLLDSGFLGQAAALGWGSHDLFGCDAGRPYARLDRAGLLWLLHGDRVVAMTADTATIETSTGARQTYRRKPSEAGRVLAWQISR